MILPFSSRRSSTSLISNCLYWASLTPRAMFSKSMNSASLRSPFMDASGRLLYVGRPVESQPGAEKVTPSAVIVDRPWPGRALARRRSRSDESRSPRSDVDPEVAGAHVRADASVRSPALDLPLLRPGRARGDLHVG